MEMDGKYVVGKSKNRIYKSSPIFSFSDFGFWIFKSLLIHSSQICMNGIDLAMRI